MTSEQNSGKGETIANPQATNGQNDHVNGQNTEATVHTDLNPSQQGPNHVLGGEGNIQSRLGQLACDAANAPFSKNREFPKPANHFNLPVYVYGDRHRNSMAKTLAFALSGYRTTMYEQLINEVTSGQIVAAGATLSEINDIDALTLDLNLQLADLVELNYRLTQVNESNDKVTALVDEINARSYASDIAAIIVNERTPGLSS